MEQLATHRDCDNAKTAETASQKAAVARRRPKKAAR